MLRLTMPDYRPAEELAALVSPAIRRLVLSEKLELVSYRDLTAAQA
jgi:hypothetical protein